MRKLTLSLIFILICSPVFGATQLKKVVAPSGGDYTSLEACMNAMETDAAFGGNGNLVTADKYFDVEISGTWSSADTTAVTIHNYTTDATRYINIYTTGNARHSGVYSTSKYRLETSNNYGIAEGEPNTTIDGLQIGVSWNGTGQYLNGIQTPLYSDTTNLKIKNNIIKVISKNTNAINTINGILISSGYNGTVYIYNNIIYGFTAVSSGTLYGINIESAIYPACVVYIYNNTIYNNENGIHSVKAGGDDYTMRIQNNICNNNSANDYVITVGTTYTFDHNIDEDGSGDITATLIFTNTGAGTEDFHLVAGDTAAIDAGVDLGSPYNIDIDGVTRSGTWDIGADEYVSPVTSRRRVGAVISN